MNKFLRALVGLLATVAMMLGFDVGLGTAHASPVNEVVASYDFDRCEGSFSLEKEPSGEVVMEAILDYFVGDVEVVSTRGLDPRVTVSIRTGYTAQVSVEAVSDGKLLAKRDFYMSCNANSKADIYVTPGYHDINARLWRTHCEPYSQTDRCRTEIWATQVVQRNGRFIRTDGWVFNNLTYKAAPRSLYANNPLGGYGKIGGTASWTQSGRNWRTECDTAATGRGGCRNYIEATVIVPDGKGGYRWANMWVLNSMVRFIK